MSLNPLEDAIIEKETVNGYLRFVQDIFPDEYAILVLLAQAKYSRAAKVMVGSSRKLRQWTKDMRQLYEIFDKAGRGDEEALKKLQSMVPPDMPNYRIPV